MLEFAAWVQENALWIIAGLIVFIAFALMTRNDGEMEEEPEVEMPVKRTRKSYKK